MVFTAAKRFYFVWVFSLRIFAKVTLRSGSGSKPVRILVKGHQDQEWNTVANRDAGCSYVQECHRDDLG